MSEVFTRDEIKSVRNDIVVEAEKWGAGDSRIRWLVDRLVASHLAALDNGRSPEIYACSQCGKAFQIDSSARKPRTGYGRFCSEECRREAKLAANRASWHRHKEEWKKKPTHKG